MTVIIIIIRCLVIVIIIITQFARCIQLHKQVSDHHHLLHIIMHGSGRLTCPKFWKRIRERLAVALIYHRDEHLDGPARLSFGAPHPAKADR